MSDDAARPTAGLRRAGRSGSFPPVAVHFKGSGFYTTDYAHKGATRRRRLGPAESRTPTAARRLGFEATPGLASRTRRSPTQVARSRTRSPRHSSSVELLGARPRTSRCGRAGGCAAASRRAASRPPLRTPPGEMTRLPAAVVLDGLSTSAPPPPPVAADERELRHRRARPCSRPSPSARSRRSTGP